MADPTFASPIPNLPDFPKTASVRLTDQSKMTKRIIHGPDVIADVPFGQAKVVDRNIVACIRPDEWLIIGSATDGDTPTPQIPSAATSVDFTHGRALIRLSGPEAKSVLEKLCDLDLSDDMTPNGAATSGYVARVVCDLIRDDQHEETSYLILFDRSYGRYLSGVLQAAMEEFVSDQV